MKAIALAAFVTITASGAHAESRWLSRPTDAEAEALTPPQARALHELSTVTLLCRLGLRGALENCALLVEAPSGYGLGAAAVSASRLTQLAVNSGTELLGQPVLVDMVFDLGGTGPHGIFPHLDGIGVEACRLKSVGGAKPPADYERRCMDQVATAERRRH